MEFVKGIIPLKRCRFCNIEPVTFFGYFKRYYTRCTLHLDLFQIIIPATFNRQKKLFSAKDANTLNKNGVRIRIQNRDAPAS